jgi:hypothetical protein
MTYSRKNVSLHRESSGHGKSGTGRSMVYSERTGFSRIEPGNAKQDTPSFTDDFNAEHTVSYISISVSSGDSALKALRGCSARHQNSPSCVYQG